MSIPDFSALTNVLLAGLDQVRERPPRSATTDADLYETATSFVVYFDAPGVAIEDAQVKFVDQSVLVRLERFQPRRDPFVLEQAGRPLGFEGERSLPRGVDVVPEEATAALTPDGRLRIHVPKG